MAEIRDVYSLEFNSGQFQSEINSAIATIEELNAAMENGADVSEELASAQENLVSILATESKGIENLNAKRNVLVNTQKTLNKESQAGVMVGKQLDATNKQIAVSTGNVVKQQKGLGAVLLSGTRKIAQMRRVASTLTFVFRSITAALPFGLILSFAGPIISFFKSWWKGADKTAENMERLNDKTLSLGERLSIAQEELDKLNSIEGKRGKLTDEEIKRRKELEQVYKDTSEEIIKAEQDRLFAIQDLQIKANRIGIKLRGETVEAIKDNLENERKAIILENDRRELELEKQILESRNKEKDLRSRGLFELADLEYKTWQQLAKQKDELWQLQTKQIEQIEKESQDRINKIYEEAAKKRKAQNDRILKEEQESIKNQQDNILEGVEQFLEEQNKLYEDYLSQKKAADERYAAEVSLKGYEDELALLADQLKTASDYRQNNRETQLAMDLLFLEQQRNQALLAAFGNAEEQEKIQKDYDKRRADLERSANAEILRIRIEFLERLRDETAAADPLLTAELNKQIAELKLQFEQLGQAVAEGADPKKAAEKYKELIDQTSQVIQFASDTVFSTLNAQLQGYIQNLDRAVDKSRTALDDIRQNSENFNARQLELEKERLERLEAERARAVEREKTLGQVQVAINAAIAISKAAAEGGGFASAFTIAATLASLIAGLAQARAAAGNAFFHGVEYLERGNNPRGRDTIPAMLNEGERVITTDTNAKYWDVLSAVHNNRIPADVLNSFANAYQSGGLRAALGAFGDNVSLTSELGNKSIFVNVGQNFSGLENRLERIESVLTELPKYMPKTIVNANAKGIFRIVEQRQQRKNYSRNWAK